MYSMWHLCVNIIEKEMLSTHLHLFYTLSLNRAKLRCNDKLKPYPCEGTIGQRFTACWELNNSSYYMQESKYCAQLHAEPYNMLKRT